ncbi:MAG TPA: response regulator [Opitutaceae bacterium]|nr:response regulator [Opitutaceae bacterium]
MEIFRYQPPATTGKSAGPPRAAAASTVASRAESEAQFPGTDCDVLLVEDDPVVSEISTAVLRQAGFDVATAADGEMGWTLLQQRDWQLLITDNCMPLLSGTDLICRIRAAGVSLPVVLTSGALPWERAPEYLQPLVMLEKPYDPKQLLGAIRRVLRAGAGVGLGFPVSAAHFARPPEGTEGAGMPSRGNRGILSALAEWEGEGGLVQPS